MVCTIAGSALVLEQYLYPNGGLFSNGKASAEAPVKKPDLTINLHRKRRKKSIALYRLSFILGEAFSFWLICTEQVPHKKSQPKFPTQVFNKSSQQKLPPKEEKKHGSDYNLFLEKIISFCDAQNKISFS